KVGDKAVIVAPGVDEAINGKVSLVSPALDPNSTTVEVWVQAKNARERLKPGTSVQVMMVARALPHALDIPKAAWVTGEIRTATVMVEGRCPDDQNANERCALHNEVEDGIRDDDHVQILEGLQEGAKVVASGAYGLPNKSRITPIESKPEAKSEKE